MLGRPNKRIGCFIIHGFTGGPFEVKPLADYLECHGYVVYCPVLAGHNATHRELSRSTYLDWINSAETAYRRFVSSCDAVVVIGFSMGSLIGAYLVRKYGADALVTISTPIYYPDFRKLVQNWVESIKIGDKERLIGKWLDYASGLKRFSLRAGFNLRKLVSLLKDEIRGIHCPLLVIQGKKDEAVKWMSAYYVYENAPSREKEIQFFPKSGHVICLDCERELVCIRIHQFIEKVVGNKLLMQSLL